MTTTGPPDLLLCLTLLIVQHASYEGPGESDEEPMMPGVDDEKEDDNEDDSEGKEKARHCGHCNTVVVIRWGAYTPLRKSARTISSIYQATKTNPMTS